MTEPINITIIIPTLNAAGSLADLVHALRAQLLQPDQILVVDSGSTDETVALARSLGLDLLTVEAGSFDHGQTRNRAAARARGKIIVFMTQDCLPLNSETLLNLIRPLMQNNNIVISYARQVAAKQARSTEKYLRLANYPPLSTVKTAEDIPALGIKTFQSSNVCAAYRRKDFEKLGGFPEPIPCNEDMLFAAKAIFAGSGVAYCADALVLHTHRLSPFKQFKRYFDIAASLELEPRIREFGSITQKGREFFIAQLAYLKSSGELTQLPCVIIDSIVKYLGFKAGTNHQYLPKWLKKRLGANQLYWSKYG